MLDISVILVSFNTLELTKRALDYLFASLHNLKMEVFIIDNASRDYSADVLEQEYPNIKLIKNEVNVGFGRANNQALPYIKSRYVLLLNTESETIAKTVQYMDANPQCGILGVKFLDGDGDLQPSCRFFPTPWNIFLNRTGMNRYFGRAKKVGDMSWDHAAIKECDWVPGCYFLIRKEVIEKVGLFDPRYFLYYEEVDLCFAAKKAGWRVIYFPHTSVVHLGGESAKSVGEITSSGKQLESLKIESEFLYFRKNHGLFASLANAILIVLADNIQILKDLIKLREPRRHFVHITHAILAWKLFFRTRMGKQPIH